MPRYNVALDKTLAAMIAAHAGRRAEAAALLVQAAEAPDFDAAVDMMDATNDEALANDEGVGVDFNDDLPEVGGTQTARLNYTNAPRRGGRQQVRAGDGDLTDEDLDALLGGGGGGNDNPPPANNDAGGGAEQEAKVQARLNRANANRRTLASGRR